MGDIEGLPFLEAMREMKHEYGMERVISLHVTLIPLIRAAGELKTKPTQHSVQELRRIGITPQIIIASNEKEIPKGAEVEEKDGYLYVTKVWAKGETIRLNFPMEIQFLASNPLVREDAGRVAVKRGPVVYCMEEADNHYLGKF